MSSLYLKSSVGFNQFKMPNEIHTGQLFRKAKIPETGLKMDTQMGVLSPITLEGR